MSGWAQGYSLKGMLAALIDVRIPGSDPASIIRTFLDEALAQEGGRELLGTFLGPRSGRTVGTALVARGHYLLACSEERGASGQDKPFSGPSLLRVLFDKGVRLDVPDRTGAVALIEGLPGTHRVLGLPIDSSVLLAKHGPWDLFGPPGSQRSRSFLAMDGKGRTLASINPPSSAFPAWANYLERALEAAPWTGEERLAWLARARDMAVGPWVPLLEKVHARWHEALLQTSLPPAPIPASPRQRP